MGGEPQFRPSTQWCNGPGGIGTFLIRLWAAPACSASRTRAEVIAALIEAQHCESDGLRLVADATSGSEYGNGAAGILDVLLRLRHGGTRPWTVSWPPGPPTSARP